MENIKRLVRKSNKLNKFLTIMKYDIINNSEFCETEKDFSKFHKLWNYVFNW